MEAKSTRPVRHDILVGLFVEANVSFPVANLVIVQRHGGQDVA